MPLLAKFVPPTVRHAVLALGIATGMGASALGAATVSYSPILPDAAFSNPIAHGTLGSTAVLDENVTGSVINQRRSPWLAENSLLDPEGSASVYSSIRSTSAEQASAVFDFTSVMGALSLVWGSPGPLNTLEFLLNGDSQLMLSGAVPQSQTGQLSVFVTVTDIRFDQLIFSAGKPAFEFANLSVVPVPLPAGLPLLAAAIAALGLLRRRRFA